MNQPKPLDLHLFVCTNQKADPKKKCCATRGGVELRAELKKRLKKKYGKSLRVNASGCLDHCSRGVAVVIYPDQEWILDADVQSADQIEKRVDELMSKKKAPTLS